MRPPTALVCVRATPDAKRRLAPVLRPHERERLMLELFGHVSDVLGSAGLSVIALSPGPLPAPASVEVWTDPAPGLNAAVAAACERLGPPVLVVHADLPWLGSADVDRLLAEPGDVVVARAHDGGTNALLLRRLVRPAFGPGSALVHARRGRALGLRTRVVDIAGFARDLDDPSALSASIRFRGRLSGASGFRGRLSGASGLRERLYGASGRACRRP